MGWASGEKDAKSSDRLDYLPVGTHDVEIINTKAGDKRNGGHFFTADCRILASNDPAIRVGDERTWYCNVDPTNKDIYPLQLGDIKSCISSCTGDPVSAIDEKVMVYVGEKSNGALVGMKARVIIAPPKSPDKPFTKATWRPFNEVLHKQLADSMRATSAAAAGA